MNSEKRKEYIDRIMLDVEGNLLNYQKFVLDCVRNQVENWEDNEILSWLNIEEENL